MSSGAGRLGTRPWLADAAIERLRTLDDRPDFSATRYELAEPIGRGGMGVVYRGRDRELDRDVAIKVTAFSTAADADRLRTEARTLARLEHPGIVAVHDVGQLPDGRVFTVMALIRGERLDMRIPVLALSDRLRLFDRICETVAFAHAHGIIHRDLKPANIMAGEHGQVLVLDWGISTASSAPGESITRAGTEGYIAPEAATQVDARTDVYALGAILRGLLPTPWPRATRPLQSIISRATDANPATRYSRVAELAADVRAFADGGAVAAHHETPIEWTVRQARTYRLPIGLVLAYLAMRGLLLFWVG